MTTTYTITDQHADNHAENVTGDDAVDIIADWFAGDTGVVHATAVELGERLARNGRDDWSRAQGLAESLGLSIERHNG